ncbi:Tim44/TimA family putative adaptor protein [Sphingomonas sp. SUN039]|uniref:Tim44/TimA family putative adaptor protein n=1 Tax=Sphingomonas sp. SUN039 TaxID=2937787 RepID=UPI002164347D|nr:Tim44/TimA family putative adaptor protein [Sphingomonas sp. SUN039]UVO55815.1 Tim44/TimA family putative adaptor protein [Sphingomonas sp. SUN039]
MVEIVVLAMVAGFLALRLYAVLGKRTGHEQPLPPVEEHSPPVAYPTVASPSRTPLAAPDSVFEEGAAAGVRAIIATEPSFDVARFIDGAKGAYRMILEAYWSGNAGELAGLTSDDVRAAFAESIADRTTAGHVLDNRLVTIEKARIVAAGVEGREARVTVAFDADIATVTRDADGTVVAGSLTDAVPTVDVWTFSRTLKSDDPNWILTDTDESA